jgi:hypothetical protein
MKNKYYAAGIANQRDDWEWQGTVVAPNMVEAKKLVVKFRKENGISGRSEVAEIVPCPTSRKSGVYNSTFIQ